MTMTNHNVSNSTSSRPPNTFGSASFLSRLLFLWPYALIRKGLVHPIEECDLPDVLPEDTSQYNLEVFEKVWHQEKERCRKKSEKTGVKVRPNLHRALLLHYINTMWDTQVLTGLVCFAQVGQAITLGYLIQTFSSTSSSASTKSYLGYVYAAILVAFGLIILLANHTLYFKTWRKGMQYRISAVAAIYAKSLRLPSIGGSTPSGKIVNLATNDVERFILSCVMISYLFWGPAQAVAVLGIGLKIVGPAFVAGYVLLLVIVALQFFLGKSFAFYRSKIAFITDRRVTLISQAISGARVMKMSGWEMEFNDRIVKIRDTEVAKIKRAAALKAWNEVVFFSCNSLVSLIIFCVDVASGGVLTPRKVFTTMSLINVVQFTLTKFTSLAVMGTSEVYVSIKRIQLFLESPEQRPQQSCNSTLEYSSTFNVKKENYNSLLSFKNVTSYWDIKADGERSNRAEDQFSITCPIALDNVTLEFRRGELCCIIGPVGCGKSSLLFAIAGELPIAKGTIERNYKSLSYAGQDSWIMNGSVRENIISDRPFDEEWYEKVVESCGLNQDFLQLSDGDMTVVGDRGIQLSGGQRARISLARALYRDSDVLVLDDPLSAVDSKVGRLIFYSAIQDLSINRGKCVVLVTHQHQFIGDARCVLMTRGGKVSHDGSYEECIVASGGLLTQALQNEEVAENSFAEISTELGGTEVIDENPVDEVEGLSAAAKILISNEQKETSESGIVQFSTYKNYVKAMGGIFIVLILLLLFSAAQVAALLLIIYFGRWAAMPAEMQSAGYTIPIILGGAIFVLTAARSLAAFFFWITASKNLHNKMTRSVLRARIVFFDTNPLGRILNRFSADVGVTDDLLPQSLHEFCVCSFLVLGGVATAFTVLPITMVALPPFLCYFVHVRNAFVKTSRELKRFEGLARSPIFAMLSESLNGIVTIRSNNLTDFFRKEFQTRHDAHSRAFFQFIATSRWLGFRMDAIMFVLLVLSSFLAVVVQQTGWINVDQAVLGLALTLLLQLGGTFQWTVRQNAEVVSYMVSVEREIGFSDLPSEAELTKVDDDKLRGWPQHGNIDIKDLTVRYRDSLPPSLSGISCSISSGSRVGIVGRTGSGKSTLVQALFRILEAEEGSIQIDGIDIASLGLHKLRSALSVIPQTPTLFSGCSVRDNLDPFKAYSDEAIHSALCDVQMSSAIAMLPGGLDYIVFENGSNFSVGQRQLLCLARAILRKNKVLVLDEPTANVDNRTDHLLQEAVRRSFEDSTILAVAHRLETVIDYDLILVIGRGKVLEYGSPAELLSNPEGHFTSMVNDCGENMAQELRKRTSSLLTSDLVK